MISEHYDVEQLSPADYLSLAESCIQKRRAIPPPATADQLVTLARNYPDRAKPFIPPPAELSRLGISTHLSCEVEALPVEFREQFLTTVQADDEFRAALVGLIGGRA